jgi:DegV family protein with EDD domain
MAKIKLLTDSACDITKEQEEAFDIQVVPFKVAMGDKSYVSRVDFDNEKFYKMMDEFDGLPATSQITVFEYEEIFEKIFADGYTDIINVTINSEGSATYGNAVMAADNFFKSHPELKDECHIYNIDSQGYTGGYGFPILQAAAKIKRGCTAKEAVDYIQDWVENCVIFFAPYSLKYAKKSGRIPSAAAFVGEVMGLRPVMRIHDHKIVTESKVRGDKAIVPKIVELCADEIIPQTPYCVVYGNDESVRDEIAKALTKKLGYPPAEYFQIGAAIAINAGPKVTGVIFKGKNK